ncbi:PepSY domain-containing protein [Pontibacter sp. CAU 1760]
MKLKSRNYYIRKSHRYLGLLLGVQFLFWTLGGLYFSWNNIDEVHGDHLRKKKRSFPASMPLASPGAALKNLGALARVDSVQSVQLIDINGLPVYQVHYFTGGKDHAAHEPGGHRAMPQGNLKVQLANAETGQLLAPLSKDQALEMAAGAVVAPAQVEEVEYLTAVGDHHEYRGRPLPAWAVTFREPNCTVYLSAEQGTYQTIRHNQWRVFDFFWMLHTMDYEGRDNIGNWLLRIFSVFGLITILSGFALYYISSPSVRKMKRKMHV